MIRALRKGEGCYDKKLAEKLSGCCNRVGERCQLPMCPLCVHQLGSSLVVAMLACMGLSSLWKTDLQISVFFVTVPGTSYFPAQKAVFGRPCNGSGRADP